METDDVMHKVSPVTTILGLLGGLLIDWKVDIRSPIGDCGTDLAVNSAAEIGFKAVLMIVIPPIAAFVGMVIGIFASAAFAGVVNSGKSLINSVKEWNTPKTEFRYSAIRNETFIRWVVDRLSSGSAAIVGLALVVPSYSALMYNIHPMLCFRKSDSPGDFYLITFVGAILFGLALAGLIYTVADNYGTAFLMKLYPAQDAEPENALDVSTTNSDIGYKPDSFYNDVDFSSIFDEETYSRNTDTQFTRKSDGALISFAVSCSGRIEIISRITTKNAGSRIQVSYTNHTLRQALTHFLAKHA